MDTKVLIADKLSQRTVSALMNLGMEVMVRPDLAAEDLRATETITFAFDLLD